MDVMQVYLAAVGEAAEPPSFLYMVLHAEPIVQVVLFLLLGMSVACWAIIANKLIAVFQATRQNEDFLEMFWRARRLDHVYEQVEDFPRSPVAQVFKAAYVELSKLTRGAEERGVMDLGGIENLSRAMRRAANTELAGLGRMIPFLATTGSTAPFIGLFGTVWGILRAFHRIGQTGQASIQVVGPDLANALIATAVGLFAAIPAVMAYNFFTARLRSISSELENFSGDFLNIVKRHYRNL